MTSQNVAVRSDLYASITEKIVAALEQGEGRFTRPWRVADGLPRNAASARAYRGINTLLLWLIGAERGYESAEWGTFRQWKELGFPVRAGEKAATIVFWKSLTRGDDAPADQDEDDRPRVVARAYAVFNAAQVDGYTPPDRAHLADCERVAKAERFFGATGIRIRCHSTQAYYQPSTDEVHIPEFARFRDADSYYATLAHECVHATGAAHRLHRDLEGRFGSDRYAMEELVAELGAAFVCGSLGLSAEPRADHAAYIASWLEVLRRDRRAIFAAASQAQQAADWLIQAASPNQAPDSVTQTRQDASQPTAFKD